ncbi:MAG: VRR-NUC domain-containing protein [Proteobacteria bacterium]|nr:VRR-NUC domain-containing protein [Pseudomonadota bacterium]
MIKSESELQKACVKWFDSNISPAQAFLFSVPNGGSRHKLEAINLKREGLKPGVADLVLLLAGGTTIFIELKHGKNGQSAKQREYESVVKGLGFNYYLIKTFNDFKTVVGYFVR